MRSHVYIGGDFNIDLLKINQKHHYNAFYVNFFTFCSITNCITDIDECDGDVHGCSDICNNNEGSYTCACESGYQLGNDDRTCTGMSATWTPC